MSRFKRLKVLNVMQESGMIPVFYHDDEEISRKIVSACAGGGARCIEMTNRGDGAINIFSSLVEHIKKNHPDLILGAGSIVDAPTAALYIMNGADFIVGPSFDEETARLCNKRKIAYSPGCATVTEIQNAHEFGVEICKIFPGEQVGGPQFVKSLLGPCPWACIMPTGGVEPTKESLSAWFKAGIVCAGIGSQLISKELIAKGDFKKISEKTRETLALIKEIRGN